MIPRSLTRSLPLALTLAACASPPGAPRGDAPVASTSAPLVAKSLNPISGIGVGPITVAVPLQMQVLAGDPLVESWSVAPNVTANVPIIRQQFPNPTFTIPVTFTGGSSNTQGTLTLSSTYPGVAAAPLPVTIPAGQTVVANLAVDATNFIASFGPDHASTGLYGDVFTLNFTSGSTTTTGYFAVRVYPLNYQLWFTDYATNCPSLGVNGFLLQESTGTLDPELWFAPDQFSADATSWRPDPTKAMEVKVVYGGSAILRAVFPDTQFSTVYTSLNAPSSSIQVNYDPSMYYSMTDAIGAADGTDVAIVCQWVPGSTELPMNPPVITSASPYLGALGGGGTVTITGAGFDTDQANHFYFNGVEAKNVYCTSSTSCVMAYPAGTGAAQVTVRTYDIYSAPSTVFWYSPSVTSVVPSSANIGDTVLVNGVGLVAGQTSITFDGVPAPIVACDTAESDWCQVKVPPPPATSSVVPNGGGVMATLQATVNGTPTDPLPGAFTWNPPAITEVVGNRGPVSGGTEVFLDATGLAPCTQNTPAANVAVYFGSVAATNVLCGQNPGQLYLYAPPASAPGVVNITVTSLGASSSLSTTTLDQFTYTQLDLIHEFTSTWSNTTLTGTIEMDAPETTATTFALSSSLPTSIEAPAQVTIPAGQSSVTFPLTVLTAYTSTQRPVLTATYAGGSDTLTIAAPPPPTTTCAPRICRPGTSFDPSSCMCIGGCLGRACLN